jgi:ankyrin repeat protein
MKSQLIAIVAAVLVVGCSKPPPDISINDAAYEGNIEVVKQHIAAGADVKAKDEDGGTPLHLNNNRSRGAGGMW